MAKDALPEKLFFKIGEVAEVVGVKAHVLRYWETEFRQLRPMKTRGSHRIYKRKDVELAVLIRRLLHDEGYTIPGARKRLKDLRAADKAAAKDSETSGATTEAMEPTETTVDTPAPVQESPTVAARREANLRAELLAIRSDLQGLLKEIDALSASAETEPQKTARVEQTVPQTARR